MTTPASRSLWRRQPNPGLLLIDGQHVPSVSGRTFKTLNPATEEVIARIAEGNEVDVDRAVAAARRAFKDRGEPCALPSAGRSCSGSSIS
jgi:Aldehyde dehydrogenase family